MTVCVSFVGQLHAADSKEENHSHGQKGALVIPRVSPGQGRLLSFVKQVWGGGGALDIPRVSTRHGE